MKPGSLILQDRQELTVLRWALTEAIERHHRQCRCERCSVARGLLSRVEEKLVTPKERATSQAAVDQGERR